LVHCIHAQKAGLALRLRLAPLPDRHLRRTCLDVVQAPLAVALAAAQIALMSNGDPSQPRILLPAKQLNFAFKNSPRCRTTQVLLRFVYAGQQLNVGSRVALGEAAPMVDRWLDTPAGCVAGDQAR
jgi:hypothetical protein